LISHEAGRSGNGRCDNLLEQGPGRMVDDSLPAKSLWYPWPHMLAHSAAVPVSHVPIPASTGPHEWFGSVVAPLND